MKFKPSAEKTYKPVEEKPDLCLVPSTGTERFLTIEEFGALPLSQALRRAVEDAKAIEAGVHADMELDADTWAVAPPGQPCTVCLAGAALFGTGNLRLVETPMSDKPNQAYGMRWPEYRRANHLLRALDACRVGRVREALLWLNPHDEHVFDDQLLHDLSRDINAIWVRESSFAFAPWDLYTALADGLVAIGR